ncbi:MAG: sulfate adenylyltransferase [Candidatus Schekmanbacteria bacterium RBG_16_38_11]|uniref:Sulfate adenylyltransferase n=1 Tax=Candidatus Schekmanbacteria bacterium RBG_16_38_11 TaxID=1817880 RepID=A0A1F7RVA3_9BACT|nr:MAG: sulfate adenylyltransferase [Candidatus Schekmanbacteria bacterium RBG_16_38_11]
MIKPHGGRLVNRIVEDKEHDLLEDKSSGLSKIVLNSREISDLEMIATGAMSPLEGFMTKEDYINVLDLKRLAKGLPWTIPVTLAVKNGNGEEYKEGSDVAMYDQENNLLGVFHLEEKYEVDKEHEAESVLLTTDAAHPGVQYLNTIGNIYLGGKISLIHRPKHTKFLNYRLDPKETRVLFKAKGWERIAAFQTRNPIHRAHEYLQKCALEIVDGLLIHPLVGDTKGDDIPADVRMKCYEALLANYYPSTRVAITVFPAAMRYAGPREAIFHALVRKNYGCTHFIVGRDHAGVGSYYGTYDAHYIFREFDPEEIDITPMFFDHAFFCKNCNNMASTKTCPHSKESHVVLSGTKVREMLSRGEIPPVEFTRPEVAKILIESMKK